MNASTVPILDFFMATDVAAAVNAVILLMVIVSVTIVLRALSRLKGEASAAKQRMRLAGESVSVGDVDQATFIGQRIALLQTLPRDSIPASLERLGATDAEQLQQQVGLARWCAAAMILLGLAGTLIGLSIGLAPVASVLGSASPGFEAFRAAMTESVAGMRTAFSTTLAGVMGAIAVGALLALYERRQGDLLIQLERASLPSCQPCSPPSRPVSTRSSSR